jgi:hypothetical protein
MLSRYAIEKSGSGWIVSADGADVLVCKRKLVALRTVRDALTAEMSPDLLCDRVGEVELRLQAFAEAADHRAGG